MLINKRKRTVVTLILLLIFAVSAAAFTTYRITLAIMSHRPESKSVSVSSNSSMLSASDPGIQLDNSGTAEDGTMETKSQEQTLSELQKQQLQITDKVSTYMQFPSGKKGSSGSWTVENPASNKVIMQCEVFLGSRSIAKTVPIKPNQHINGINLTDDIAPGTYKAVACIYYFNPDTNVYISQSQYTLSLTVK